MTDQTSEGPTPSNASRWLMNLFGTCIALAVVLWFFIPFVQWGGSDLPLITKRAEWPPAVEELFQGAELPAQDVVAIEVTPSPDGFFLRMPASEATIAFVEERLTPLDEIKTTNPRIAQAMARFWDQLPHRWRMHKPREEDRFFANVDWDLGDEGRFNYVARVNDEDRVVLIWSPATP